VVGAVGDGRPPLFLTVTSSAPPLNAAAELPITWAMSIQTTLQRVDAIRQALADPAKLVGSEIGATGGTEAPASAAASGSAFAAALAQANASALGEQPAAGQAYGVALSGVAPAGYGSLGTAAGAQGAGGRILAAAQSQIGQAEQPPGSNESPAIAEYRAATAGAAPGEPWCAYFVSWAAREAGEPIGPAGQGLGSVSAIWSWAQSAGRAVANGPGVVPHPGDLIVFGGEHVGIVREVLPDGRIATIEGNFQNQVSANIRSAGEASGYVSMS
jgi:hypothetical protein